MRQQYYYFVSSLPDIVLDERQDLPEPNDFMLLANEHVSDKDLELLSILCMPADNKNLLIIINKESDRLLSGGRLSKDDLARGLKDPQDLPKHMADFLSDIGPVGPMPKDISPADQLSWHFYEFAISHENDFIRKWFSFDLNMRNLLAGLSCRKYGFPLQQHIISVNDAAELMLKSHASDFSLSSIFPHADKVCWLDPNNPVAFQKAIDEIRWDYACELTDLSYFQVENVLSFMIRLDLACRWNNLKHDIGKKQFEKYTKELSSQFQFTKEFQIS